MPEGRGEWAVFGLLDGFDQARFEDAVEQPGTSRPRRLSVGPLHPFTAPTPELLATVEGGARHGIARLPAYDDPNGNRREDADQAFIGGADRRGRRTPRST